MAKQCMTCSERRAAASRPVEPYEVLLPDGTKKIVASKHEERIARDQAYARMRQAEAQQGYRVRR